MSSTADTLTVSSRAFYERSKAKLGASIIIAAGSLMLLGFCSIAGGQAAALQQSIKQTNDAAAIKILQAQVSGYGFGAFVYILAFFLLVSASIYISPLFCGSTYEKTVIATPMEIDSGYTAYNDRPSTSSLQGGASGGINNV